MPVIQLPGSKSISNRLLLFREVSGLPFQIHNISESKDTQILINALKDIDNGKQDINVGDAGTAMRFLCAYLAFKENFSGILTGSFRMQERPIESLVNALTNAGAQISYISKQGYPPIKIKGVLPDRSNFFVDAGISSQFTSAIMLMAPLFKNGLAIKLQQSPVSFSYVLLTAALLHKFGVKSKISANEIEIFPITDYNKITSFNVEADWSAASYFYNAMLVGNIKSLQLTGLEKNSFQPDAVVADIYQLFGIETEYVSNGVVLKNTFKLHTSYFEYDFTNCPDIAQTLAVSCFSKGIGARLSGLKTLQFKETERISALTTELKKLGAKTETTHEEILIYAHDGIRISESLIINCYNDHRMAMSFSPLTFIFPQIKLEDESVADKSFPGFFMEINKVFSIR